MGLLLVKRRFFMSEPHSMVCPKCNTRMIWDQRQGPLGGWSCPNCGFRQDRH